MFLFKKFVLFTVLNMTLMTGLWAKEYPLVRVTNDEDPVGYTFIVELDQQGDIIQLIKESDDKQRTLYQLDERGAIPETGFVIDYRMLRDIVVITGPQITPQNGGELTITYLYDGRPGMTEHRELKVDLVREGDSWFLVYNGVKLGKMYFKTRKVRVFGSVGVEEVQLFNQQGQRLK